MNEEEIQEAFKEWEFDKDEYWSQNTRKRLYQKYSLVAYDNHKKMKVTKIINDKRCEVKVITTRGLDLNGYNVRDFYNEDLEHIEKNIKIIDFEIV